MQERSRLRVGPGVEHLVRVAGTAEEHLQRDDARMVRRPEYHRPAGMSLDQPHAAQDQRPHDPFAQLGLGDQHRAQLLGRNVHRLDVAQRIGVHQRRAAAELSQLAQERAGAVGHDGLATTALELLADPHLPSQDQADAVSCLAHVQHRFACAVENRRAEAAQPLNLVPAQYREHLRTARAHNGCIADAYQETTSVRRRCC